MQLFFWPILVCALSGACTIPGKTYAAVKHHRHSISKTLSIPNKSSLKVVDINKVDISSLAKLKGMSIKQAQLIIDYREKNSQFHNVEALHNVHGMSVRKIAKIMGDNQIQFSVD